jgi:signal transduction protein with GAF and PtsI domain
MDIERPDFESLFSELDVLACSVDNFQESVHSCFDKIMTAMGAERGFLLLCKGKGEEIDWKPFAGHGINLDTLFETEAVSKSIIRSVVEGKKSLITTNAMDDPRFSNKKSVVTSEIRSVICAPLMSEMGFFGLIYLDNRFSRDFFEEKDRDYLIKCARKLSKIIARSKPDILPSVAPN